MKPGHGFAELTAAARGDARALVAVARGEVGVGIPGGSAFAFGEAALGPSGPAWQAGVGARVTW